jgi:hypothetical protein
MTDQERATQFVLTWAGDDVMVPEARDLSRALAAQFTAVRLEERRAIVAFVRRRYVADALALAVERGDHAS